MNRAIALSLLFALAVSPASGADEGWSDLFNGKDLAGWKNPYDWGEAWVEDGVICLKANKKFFLVTEKPYGDFELECQIMLPKEGPANSGIMYRCHVEKNKVFGYQAECDPTDRAWSGGLYDEGRRKWLHPKNSERGKTKLVQAPLGEWMTYRIKCVGDHLQVWVNGKQTTDYRDKVDAAGYIGIQHHGEKGKVYRFRGIRIREINKQDAATSWEPLFDGKSLTGWTQRGGKATYAVKDGTIVGTTAPSTPNSFLCTEKNYGDFVLEYEFKCHPELNSGVQIRSNAYDKEKVYDVGGKKIKVAAGRVHGYQVEIDANKVSRAWMSGIYDESRRGWLYPGPKGGDAKAFTVQGQKLFKAEQWNHVRVECSGNRIRTFLNGELRADFEDDLTASGFIGLQVHGVGKRKDPISVAWRNIRIQEIAPTRAAAWKPLITDGLTGWHISPGGTWDNQNGVIIGKSPKSERRHGMLITDDQYGDFSLKATFRVVSGNSGLYFRAAKVDHPVALKGFQAEVDRTMATGGLYETLGRAWVAKPNATQMQSVYKPGEWTKMSVDANGGHIVVHVNGYKTVELKDDPGLKRGHIGLQLHGGQEMHVEFKDVMIRPLN